MLLILFNQQAFPDVDIIGNATGELINQSYSVSAEFRPSFSEYTLFLPAVMWFAAGHENDLAAGTEAGIAHPEPLNEDQHEPDLFASSCVLSLTWSMGHVDPQFGVSEKEVIEAMNTVIELWSTAVDSLDVRQVDEGGVRVQLVYDERQDRSRRELEFRETLITKGNLVDTLKAEYNSHLEEYEMQSAEYLQLLSVFSGRTNRLNEWIRELNQAGGATETEKEEIREMQESLKELDQIKNEKRKELNNQVDHINELTIRLNQIVHEKNQLIYNYNRDFASTDRFVSGTYERRGGESTISIYKFITHRDLEVVLAHEFGHALGIDHVSNPRSIMYALMTDQSYFTDLALTEEDKAAARALCP